MSMIARRMSRRADTTTSPACRPDHHHSLAERCDERRPKKALGHARGAAFIPAAATDRSWSRMAAIRSPSPPDSPRLVAAGVTLSALVRELRAAPTPVEHVAQPAQEVVGAKPVAAPDPLDDSRADGGEHEEHQDQADQAHVKASGAEVPLLACSTRWSRRPRRRSGQRSGPACSSRSSRELCDI